MRFPFGAAALAAIVLLTAPVAAQDTYGRRDQTSSQTVTLTDIQRLQDQVYDISNDLSRARNQNSDQTYRVQNELDDVRDEVVYLRVKLRKEGRVSYSEYADVRDHIQRLRSQVRGDSSNRGSNSPWDTNAGTAPEGTYGGARTTAPGSNPPYPSGTYGGTNDQQTPRSTRRGEVPAGQELDVRLERELNSETAQVEDRFNATTVVDLYQGNDVLIPAGSQLRGVVSSVNKATRTNRKGSLTVAFDQITVHGRSYPIRATVTQALESEGIKGEIGKIGAGSAVGAIIGGIIGGAKGALLGVLIGGGGTIAATEGKDVDVPAGTILRIRLDEPIQVR
jgi:hypothetical protein